MEEQNENIKKLKLFFKYDLAIKQLLNRIIPQEIDFYDKTTKLEYKERIIKNIEKINLFLSQMLTYYNMPEELSKKWEKNTGKFKKT